MAAPCPDAAASRASRPSDVVMITTLEPSVVPAQSGNQVRVHIDALQPCVAYHVLFGGSVGALRESPTCGWSHTRRRTLPAA